MQYLHERICRNYSGEGGGAMLLVEEGAYFPDLIFVNRFDEFFMCGLVRSPYPLYVGA